MWRNYIKKIVIMLCCSMILLACDDTKSEEVNPEKFDPKEFENSLEENNWKITEMDGSSDNRMYFINLSYYSQKLDANISVSYTIYLEDPERYSVYYTDSSGVLILYASTTNDEYGNVGDGRFVDGTCYYYFDENNPYDKEICDKNDENKVIELKEIYEEKLKKDGFTHEEFYDYLLYRSQQIKNEDSK